MQNRSQINREKLKIVRHEKSITFRKDKFNEFETNSKNKTEISLLKKQTVMYAAESLITDSSFFKSKLKLKGWRGMSFKILINLRQNLSNTIQNVTF